MRILTIAAALLIFGASLQVTEACRCRQPPTPLIAKDASTAVFYGKVTGVALVNNSHHVTIEVEKSWKGELKKVVTIRTATNSAACGYNFKVGEKYLVYSTKGEGQTMLQTNTCTRTRGGKEALVDIKELDGAKAG